MKYKAEKQIKALSSKYEVKMKNGDLTVTYKNMLVAWFKNNKRYLFYNSKNCFKKMQFCNNLYAILAELAMTTLDKRLKENKHYAKIYDGGHLGYLKINILTGKMMVVSVRETNFIKTKFTDKEIEQLKQRDDIPLDWNKVTLE